VSFLSCNQFQLKEKIENIRNDIIDNYAINNKLNDENSYLVSIRV